MKGFAKIIFILSVVWFYYGGQAAGDGGTLSGEKKIYRLGVQMDTSREECLKNWQPMADYLSQKIPGSEFRLIPLKIGVISYAIENGDVDFAICNPAFFAIFCDQYNASQLATRINNNTGKPFSRCAGVIFCRADNESIYSISDLKGKSFAYPHAYSLGGWLAVWREMTNQNFDPKQDIRELQSAGTQNEVVFSVLSGKADAGSVRSDVLASMARKKMINLADFRIINRKHDDFELPHSTECYPEWGMIQLQHVDDDIAKAVVITLLQMTPDNPAAQAAEIQGWCSPENYRQVIQCLEDLNVSPYMEKREFSWAAFLKKNMVFAIAIAVFLILTIIVHIIVIKSNRRNCVRVKDLLREHDSLMMIFNNTDEGLACCNDRDEIIHVNPSFCRLTGFSADKLVSGDIFRKLPPDIYNVAGKLLGEYRRNVYTQPHEMNYCINGVDVLLRIRPFYVNKKFRGSLFSLTEIKELMTAKRETAAINRELEDSIRRSNRLAARALQATKLKNSALAAMNRDIRTPLTGIMGLVNILENTDLQPQQQNYIAILKDTTESIISLLGRAMDMSLLAKEDVELDRVLFSVRDEISQVEKLFKFRADEKEIALSCIVDQDVPQKICNAPDRLRQILINLLSNALRYVDKGNVSLRVTTGETTQKGCEIIFIVSDTGMGMSPEKLEHLFDDVRSDDSTLNVHTGTGMGLVISRKLARLMGGDLTAESSPGIGSTFTLKIMDFHGDCSGAVTDTQKTAPAGSENMLDGLRVLIAEDNQVNRLVLHQILMKHGCRVTCVENGRDAVEEVKNGDFDIILMDCHMPILDGFEATIEIRSFSAPRCNLPILAITANALPQIKDYCFRCGMNGFVSKPFSSETIKTAIISCMTGDGEAAAGNRPAVKSGTENIDVDHEALMERIGKSGDVMKRIVKLFLEDCVKSIEQLHQCFNENNMEQAAAVAHSIKGSSALAGASCIQNAASEIEQAAIDRDRESLGKGIEIIEECFKKYKSAVSTCI